MSTLYDDTSHEVYARQLFAERKSQEEMEQLLLERTGHAELAKAIITRIKKEHHDRNMKSGKTKILIAVIILGTSFLITCLNFHAGVSFAFIMYSFTIIGVSLLLWGGYNILN